MAILEKSWVTQAGLPARVIHNTYHRCGYVGVGESSPLFGVAYTEHLAGHEDKLEAIMNAPRGDRGIVSLVCWDGEKVSPEILFDVHGSLTFSNHLNPTWDRDKLWWFGFDCGHVGDTQARWTREAVAVECERLAKQLKEFK